MASSLLSLLVLSSCKTLVPSLAKHKLTEYKLKLISSLRYSGCLLDLARGPGPGPTLEGPGLEAAALDLAPEVETDPGVVAEIIHVHQCQTDAVMTAIVKLRKNLNVLVCSG